jgi:ubiquinone/menaquinone biosynthesis C-methylase UbiE
VLFMDQAKLESFVGKVVGDLAVALSAPLVLAGEKLGLYRAMSQAGAMTPAELAKKTKTSVRYVTEWLGNQAASGYVEYDAATGRYTLPPEHAMALADELSPVFLMGGFEVVDAAWRGADRTARSFRTGKGVPWGAHHPSLFRGTERFFGPSYRAHLVGSWIPALEGVVEKLNAGATVADVGCGHGISTTVMAKAFPKSKFTGFDAHAPSVREATKRARAAGVAKNAKFEVARSNAFPGKGYDLVCFFDCFHDMGDPLGAAKHVRKALAKSGTWMLVEPFAGDRVEQNLNAVGRCYYAASTQICVPASLSEGKASAALGAQAGEAKLAEVIRKAGFKTVRRATATPFNLVLEAKP